jgi:hypothetical protein
MTINNSARSKYVTSSFQVLVSHLEELDAIGQVTGATRSAIIRKAIEQYLRVHGKVYEVTDGTDIARIEVDPVRQWPEGLSANGLPVNEAYTIHAETTNSGIKDYPEWLAKQRPQKALREVKGQTTIPLQGKTGNSVTISGRDGETLAVLTDKQPTADIPFDKVVKREEETVQYGTPAIKTFKGKK